MLPAAKRKKLVIAKSNDTEKNEASATRPPMKTTAGTRRDVNSRNDSISAPNLTDIFFVISVSTTE